ncbi:MAG: hypothetical protein ABIU54_09390 [Candidatus Eisenbacteria bacterium]
MSVGTGSPRHRERGRYELFFADQACGEERFDVIPTSEGGSVVTGEQTLEAPHPLAGQQRFRATVSPEGRVLGVEVDWLVGTRALHAQHRAQGGLWHVRIDYAGHVREQEGDYPPSCEVLFGSPLFQTFALRHYVLAPGAEHEFAALLIGPPYMAVEPGKQQVRCTEARMLDSPFGPVEARRVEMLDPAGADLPVVLWIDADERVLESRDGVHDTAPLLLRLVELVTD